MKIAFFDTHKFEKPILESLARSFNFQCEYFEMRLDVQSAKVTHDFDAVCIFVNDMVNAECLHILAKNGVRFIALRCAGFNNVDLLTAEKLGIKVVRVPEYSPHAVAEHAIGLILCLNRKLHRAFTRIHEQNFSLDGLVGFDLFEKKVLVIGTGKIGKTFSKIMRGFGCDVILNDLNPDLEFSTSVGATYKSLPEAIPLADIISLHCPLNKDSRHLVDKKFIDNMKPGAMLINTGRGALIDAKALVEGLKSKKVGAAGLDVYEEEEGVFFQDLSEQILSDDTLARLLSFPNVMITSHQAFLTTEALTNIATTTFKSLNEFRNKSPLTFEVKKQ